MDILATRRSIRTYLDKAVSDELLEKVMRETIQAPSGSNTQPWKYLIIKDEATKKKIVAVDHNQKWMLEAPIFIICLADAAVRFDDVSQIDFRDDSPEFHFKQLIRDNSVGITYLLLAAEQNGLGACWTAWYDHNEMKEVLNIPKHMYVNGVVTLGYANQKPVARPRVKFEDVVFYDKLK